MSDAIENFDEKRDVQHVDSPGDLKWSDVKLEAERDEAYQHGLSVRKSLKVYRAVSRGL